MKENLVKSKCSQLSFTLFPCHSSVISFFFFEFCFPSVKMAGLEFTSWEAVGTSNPGDFRAKSHGEFDDSRLGPHNLS